MDSISLRRFWVHRRRQPFGLAGAPRMAGAQGADRDPGRRRMRGAIRRAGERVDQNHHLRDRGIKGKCLNIAGDFFDCGVQDFEFGFLEIDFLHLAGNNPFTGLILLHD